MSRTAYYDRLSGTTKWSAAEVKRAADVLGVEVATLFNGLSVAGAGFEPATSGSRARDVAAVIPFPHGGSTRYNARLTQRAPVIPLPAVNIATA